MFTVPLSTTPRKGSSEPSLSYLPGGVVRQPALQVGRVPAREQAAALQVAQLRRGLGCCGDHLVEGVIERHGVTVSALVLKKINKLN